MQLLVKRNVNKFSEFDAKSHSYVTVSGEVQLSSELF